MIDNERGNSFVPRITDEPCIQRHDIPMQHLVGPTMAPHPSPTTNPLKALFRYYMREPWPFGLRGDAQGLPILGCVLGASLVRLWCRGLGGAPRRVIPVRPLNHVPVRLGEMKVKMTAPHWPNRRTRQITCERPSSPASHRVLKDEGSRKGCVVELGHELNRCTSARITGECIKLVSGCKIFACWEKPIRPDRTRNKPRASVQEPSSAISRRHLIARSARRTKTEEKGLLGDSPPLMNLQRGPR
ncbi:hypothetical protein B0T10DRAFT_593926 [Thelonectria olida]|uniref:Uncharacterized protein n=1 Tax=Thelonectria olida TaxID=1576542 RepID=A0A9P9AR03_9HYPO|nr:hypothetical protein B0T10DRAFT_593926 [Thelonectria olida]